jgi:hypothetical protein
MLTVRWQCICGRTVKLSCMKKIPVTVISLVLLQGIIYAQETKSAVAKDAITTVASRDTTAPIPISSMILISQMDQTKNYRWDNGQTATPTGRQAGDPSAVYARVLGDSAVVVYDWREKIKSLQRSSAKK